MNIKYIILILAFIITSCTPAELAIAEAVTEEALIIEEDLVNPPSVSVNKENSVPVNVSTPTQSVPKTDKVNGA